MTWSLAVTLPVTLGIAWWLPFAAVIVGVAIPKLARVLVRWAR